MRNGIASTGKNASGGGLTDYGQSPGQLGSMAPGSVDAVLSSPPYAETSVATERNFLGSGGGKQAVGAKAQETSGYGTTSGNLGNLPAGDVAAVVSSPPYAASMRSYNGDNSVTSQGLKRFSEYGETDGNLGNMSDEINGRNRGTGETFWTAARDIVAECFAILKPGGVAAWVVKGFVRNKQLVDFPHDWQRLCEACGFVLIEEIHASLVKESRNKDLFGGVKVDRTERKSFFRRLAEKKGSPKIDFETVLVMRKPVENGGVSVGCVGCVVSSPPFVESLSGVGECPTRRPDGSAFGQGRSIDLATYGSSPGQLGSMKPGDIGDVIQ